MENPTTQKAPPEQNWQPLLAHLHRGGQWAYYWQAANIPPTWFRVGETLSPPTKGNVYFSVHPGRERRNEYERGGLDNVAAINCLFSEYDCKDYGSQEAVIEHIGTLPVPPSVVVNSGGGIHCYWLLTETVFVTDNLEALKDIQARWVAFTGGDKGAKDLARVLRLPGTFNHKYAPSRPVFIITADYEQTFPLDELTALLPEDPPSKPIPLMPVRQFSGQTSDIRPIDAFLANQTFADVLTPFGWKLTHTRGSVEYWQRPGKKATDRSHSATVGHNGHNILYVFSSSAQPFEPETGYSLATAYVLLNHDGDFKAAAQALKVATQNDDLLDLLSNDDGQDQPAEQGYWALTPNQRKLIIVEDRSLAETLQNLGHSAYAWDVASGAPSHTDLTRMRTMQTVYLALKNGRQERLCQALGPLTMINLPDLSSAISSNNPEPDENVIPLDELLQQSRPWLDVLLEQVKHLPPHELAETTGLIARLLRKLPDELSPRYYQLAQRRLGMTKRELNALARPETDPKQLTFSSVRDGQLCFLSEPLGNWTATITGEQARDNGMDTPVVEYTISGQLADGTPLTTISIPAEQFLGMDWIARYWGARPILYLPRGKAYLAARAIQEISLPTLKQERVYTYTGWREIDGQRGFLSGSGFLTTDGLNESVRVDLGGTELRHYALPKPPTGKALQEAIRSSLGFLDLGPRAVTAPLWAAMFAAAFTEIRPLYSVLWVYGTTQSGKSTIAHLCLTHFGTGFINGRQYLPPENWESSLTALEGSMFTVKDCPLIIDDYAPQFASTYDAREMQRTAQKVVRRAGNRTARNRSKSDLTQQLYRPPRGLVLITAELPLAGESTAGRMLYIPVAPGDILPIKGDRTTRPSLDLAQRQAEAGLYGQAMAAFLQWLAANWERAVALFLEIIEEAALTARNSNVQNRLPDYYANLDAAQRLALLAFYEMGVLSASEAADIQHLNGEAILEVVVSQAERIATESPVRKFFEALNSLLERQKVYLAPKTAKVTFTPPQQADLIGYFDPNDETVIYLNDDACLEHVREYWAKLGENFDTTKDALRRQISQIEGLVARRDAKNILYKTWIAASKSNTWVLAISRTKVENLYSVEIKNRLLADADIPNEAVETLENDDEDE
jgi:hypothetical protein